MATTASEVRAESRPEPTGLSYYMRDSKIFALGMALVLGIALFAIWFQQSFGHLYGLDSHAPEFDAYFMRFLKIELITEVVVAVALWSWLWKTRDRNMEAVGPKEEVQRYFSFVMWLGVYTFAVYWAASYFAEQDGAWHQVVTRDTAFTPSHSSCGAPS